LELPQTVTSATSAKADWGDAQLTAEEAMMNIHPGGKSAI
jgi:hypothetical protein